MEKTQMQQNERKKMFAAVVYSKVTFSTHSLPSLTYWPQITFQPDIEF
jgi:hypothetical protein